MIPAGTDYEMRFSEIRTAENCHLNPDYSIAPRILVMIFCLASIVLLIPYRYYYIKWRQHLPITYRELPSMGRNSFAKISRMKRPLWHDYIAGDTIFALTVNLIFPYPGLNSSFTFSQQILYKQVYICYFWGELLYACMFFRWAYLIYILFNYGSYQNQIAMRYCEKYDIPQGPAFSLKCYVNQNPLAMLFFFFLIPGILIFASTMRVFERPMRNPNTDFDYPGNAM